MLRKLLNEVSGRLQHRERAAGLSKTRPPGGYSLPRGCGLSISQLGGGDVDLGMWEGK